MNGLPKTSTKSRNAALSASGWIGTAKPRQSDGPEKTQDGPGVPPRGAKGKEVEMQQFKIDFYKPQRMTPEATEIGHFKDFEAAEKWAEQKRRELECRSFEVQEYYPAQK